MGYQSDEEQLELLKRYWRAYGKLATLGVFVIFVVFFGFQIWEKQRYEASVEASQLYDNLMELQGQSMNKPLTTEQLSTMEHIVNSLKTKYASSRYTAFAVFILVKQKVDEDKLDQAGESLEWILEQKFDEQIDALARIRLARVLLAQSPENGSKSLEVLDGIKQKDAFIVSREDVRGDIYLTMGQLDKAGLAYQKAMDTVVANGESRPLLQLKLDDLALPTVSDKRG